MQAIGGKGFPAIETAVCVSSPFRGQLVDAASAMLLLVISLSGGCLFYTLVSAIARHRCARPPGGLFTWQAFFLVIFIVISGRFCRALWWDRTVLCAMGIGKFVAETKKLVAISGSPLC